jgi:hypothetical protein
MCADVFEATPESHIGALVDRYPEMALALKDPHLFLVEMNKRFQEQKAKTPERPLDFDFSEMGLPTVKALGEMIPKKMAELDQWKIQLSQEGIKPFWFPKKWENLIPLKTRLALGKKTIQDIEVGQQYLLDLQKEINQITTANHISYIHTLELSYFFSRAIGHFDRFQFTPKFKALMLVEYALQGYKDLEIQTEYRMYKNREFSLFQLYSKHGATADAAKELVDAFQNQTELKVILLPSHLSLSLDVFYRLQAAFIYPVGITDRPVAADGVLRHGGLFYAHDMGHSGLMLQGARMHQEVMTPEQLEVIRSKMSDWYVEYKNALDKVDNPALKVAIRQLAFNIHHERGYPLVPSVYTDMKKPPSTTYLLFLLYGMNGQMKVMGKSPEAYIPEAFKWLKEFWKQREAQEQTIFGPIE